VLSPPSPDIPVIIMSRPRLKDRDTGGDRDADGLVVVVGDTEFAMNVNLEELERGYPIEELRENAVFWRYLISLLREGVDETVDVRYPRRSDTLPEDSPEQDLALAIELVRAEELRMGLPKTPEAPSEAGASSPVDPGSQGSAPATKTSN
jgi:hypothetical protein